MSEAKEQFVTVLYDYTPPADSSNTLSVTEGQVIQFLTYGSESEQGFSLCKNIETNEEGFIPTSYHTRPMSFERARRFSHVTVQQPAQEEQKGKGIENTLALVTAKLKKRRELVKETLKTEETYVRNLTIYCNVYAKEATKLVTANCDFNNEDYQLMFGSVKNILRANSVLLESLKKELARVGDGCEDMCCVGKVFQEIAPYFKMYTDFINNYDKAYDTFKRVREQKFFETYVLACLEDPLIKSAGQGVDTNLKTLLINPIQRIPRYQMLLQGIAEVTDQTHDDSGPIQAAVEIISKVAKYCDESKAVSGALATYYRISSLLSRELKFSTFIQSHRRFIFEIPISATIISKKATKINGLGNVPSPRSNTATPPVIEETGTIYLFNDTIVIEKDPTSTSRQNSNRNLLLITAKQEPQMNNDPMAQLFFLHFSTMTSKPMSGSITIETISDNMKKTILIRAKDQHNDKYMQQFEHFKDVLQECITSTQTIYVQRANLEGTLMKTAADRMSAEEKKNVTHHELRTDQVKWLESKKNLQKKESEVSKKEEEILKLQEELRLLKEERDNFANTAKGCEEKLLIHEDSVQTQIKELCRTDDILFGSLNAEVESFRKIFCEEPMTTISQIGNADDIYKGRKQRHRDSITSVTEDSNHGKATMYDYTGFCENPLMEQLERNYGETVVVFTSMVHHINAYAAARECRLVITDTSLFVYNGAGSSVKIHIPIANILCLSTSSLDNHIFCIHSEEQDLLFSSVKKTEILEQLVVHNKTLTNRDLTVQVSSMIAFNPIPNNVKTIVFESSKTLDVEFSIQADVVPDLWKIVYNSEIEDSAFASNKMLKKDALSRETNDVLIDSTPAPDNDPFSGTKLRNRASIDRKYYGDYILKMRPEISKKLLTTLNENITNIKFCDEVQKMDLKFKPQSFVMIISDNNIYLTDQQLKTCKMTISLKDIEQVSVSNLNDNYFCIHHSSGVDELFISHMKTEIIQVLKQVINELFVLVTQQVTLRKKDKTLAGTFQTSAGESSSFQVSNSSNSFTISVSRRLSSILVLETMEVLFDGLQPLVILHDSPSVPVLKLPSNCSRLFTATIGYYALDNVTGYKIDQKLTSSTSVVTELESTQKSDQKYVVHLKKQTLAQPRFSRMRRMKTRVLDNQGNEIGSFTFDVQF